MTNLMHYENVSCKNLQPLIFDSVTYSVLIKILNQICTHVFTDKKHVIICHSNPPYPVWVWCNNYSYDNLCAIAHCIKKHFALENGYNVILSQELLENLQKIDAYFLNVSLKMQLFSYRLDKINNISYPVNGKVLKANKNDINALANVYHDMVYEMEGFDFDKQTCENKVSELMQNGGLYTFVNQNGEIVATTAMIKSDGFYKISAVYTLPNQRRKGYAINLVHALCKKAVSEGVTPILYTDGNYNASNECYKKIGFFQVGKLLNIQNK